MGSRHRQCACSKQPGNAASRRFMANARELLASPPIGLSSDDLLSERERIRLDEAARRFRQGQLRLLSKGRA